MPNDFDPNKDMPAILKALKDKRPATTHDDAELSEHIRKEHEAHIELKRRLQEFRIAQTKEKEEWVFRNLQLVAPLWAVKWALFRKRGWILRLFRVTLDPIGFSRHMEMFEIRKGGKLVAIKLFRWDSGDHLEGVRK